MDLQELIEDILFKNHKKDLDDRSYSYYKSKKIFKVKINIS